MLYTKLHNFHWFVKGFQFYQIHQLFEAFYDEATETFDAIAERLLMLGEKPVRDACRVSCRTRRSRKRSATETMVEMVKATLADFELLNNGELTEIVKLRAGSRRRSHRGSRFSAFKADCKNMSGC
ncbi:MAG: hypothetical protein MZU97_17340 [Bacillus subtilis]|nr:hypothetical protein [Bacillus subtilis]